MKILGAYICEHCKRPWIHQAPRGIATADDGTKVLNFVCPHCETINRIPDTKGVVDAITTRES